MFAAVLFTALFTVSCDKTEDVIEPEVNQNFSTLKTYLTANQMDIPDVLNSWITTAEAVYTVNNDSTSDNDYYVIDIRSASAYAAGHIGNAVNATLDNLLTKASNSNNHPIIVACYTGQTASLAVVALRLSGYPTAKVMKWGMSGWSSTLDSWTLNCSDYAVGKPNFAAAPGVLGTLVNYGDPVLTATATDGAGILAERVAALLAAGFKGVAGSAVVDAPADYYINNYWTEADVIAHGNIATAVRVLPLSLAGNEYQNYNPTATAVTYCWTGQTSSMVTAYMNVIGYNAVSLKFGTNSIIHSDIGAHGWDVSMAKNYPLVQ